MFMISLKSFIYGKKSVPFVDVLSETTREGINKAYIPKFLYKPPFGYPRFANMSYIRYLAQTPYVEMCIDTIIKELISIPWDIVPNPDIPKEVFENEDGDFTDQTKLEIAHQKHFLENPNTNPNEYFEDVFIKMPIRDILEINTGIINKVFNIKEEMVECVARDGATFTKNPDVHGMYTTRADLILAKHIVESPHEVINPFVHISSPIVREQGAYFQYGWIAGPVPVPFGKREIVWIQNMIRSDDIYGYSPIQLLAKNLQMLLYQIESDLEYYNDNNVPKGIIGLDASDADEIKSFKEQWYEQTRRQDEFGNWKKMMNKVPILNYIPKFERIEFSSSEIQLIEKQKWYSKMVWSCFGVTPVELGYTEDAKGTANQIIQSKVFRKKAINPNLRLLTNGINKEILPEFEYVYNMKLGKETVNMPKYLFKFMVFDIDEEKSKMELFEKQIDNGVKTVNEIRKSEGDEPVDWGDERPQKFREQAQQFNIGEGENFSKREEETRKQGEKPTHKVPGTKEPTETGKKVEKEIENQKARKVGGFESPEPGDLPEKGKKILAKVYASCRKGGGNKEKCAKIAWDAVKDAGYKAEKKSIESKPFAGYANFAACVRSNQDKRDPKAYCATILRQVEGKAADLGSPLLLKEGERPTEKHLEKAIDYVLKQNEKKIKALVEQEHRKGILEQIKSQGAPMGYPHNVEDKDIEIKALPQLIEKLKSLLSFAGLKGITYAVIKSEFMKGADQSEGDINKVKSFNYVPDNNAINYITNYTFNNIKGMTDDVADKLRSELQRAFMNGEGIDQIKSRITAIFDIGENRAEMIARTETSRSHSFGKLSAYKQSGIKAKKWILWTDDHRTSDISKSLHTKYGSIEQAIPLDDNFKDTVKVGKKTVIIDQATPPFHINERCEIMFTIVE